MRAPVHCHPIESHPLELGWPSKHVNGCVMLSGAYSDVPRLVLPPLGALRIDWIVDDAAAIAMLAQTQC